MSNGNRNAKELLEMILGSAEVQQKFKDKEKEKAQFLKTFVKNLREKIRSQIDANLPFMYLVDASVIVDSMLRTLNPANKKITGDLMDEDGNPLRPAPESPFAEFETKGQDSVKGIELFKYFISVEGIDEDGQIIKYTNKPNLEPGLKEAYTTAWNKLLAKREEIIASVLNSIRDGITKEITVQTISNLVSEVISERSKSGSTPQKIGYSLRTKLNILGVSEITDPQTLSKLCPTISTCEFGL